MVSNTGMLIKEIPNQLGSGFDLFKKVYYEGRFKSKKKPDRKY